MLIPINLLYLYFHLFINIIIQNKNVANVDKQNKFSKIKNLKMMQYSDKFTWFMYLYTFCWRNSVTANLNHPFSGSKYMLGGRDKTDIV